MKKIIFILLSLFFCNKFHAINTVMNDIEITGSTSLLNGTQMCQDGDKVYFFGSNRKLYYTDLSTTGYSVTCISDLTPGSYINARDYSGIYAINNQIFYVGTNNKIVNYYLSGGVWYCATLNPSSQDVASGCGFGVDPNTKIYYIGFNNNIYELAWTGAWSVTTLPVIASPSCAAAGSKLYVKYNQVFYAGVDGKLYNYYKSGGSWYHGVLNNSAPLALSGTFIDLDESDQIFYTSTNNKVYRLTWVSGTGWTYTLLSNTTIKTHAGPKVQKYCGKIYYIDNATNAVGFFFYTSGAGWTSNNIYANNSSTQTAYSSSNVSDVFVTTNGDVIYNSSSGSNNLHILTPKINWTSVAVGTCPAVYHQNTWNSNELTLYKPLRPKNYQFYPRNGSNTGTIPCDGTIWGYYDITWKIEKTNFSGATSTYTVTSPVGINQSTGTFSTSLSINAELSEYAIYYKLGCQTKYTLLADKVVCGDAYIASGQSNMLGLLTSSTEKAAMNNLYGPGASNPYGKYSRTFGSTFAFENSEWGVSQLGDDQSSSSSTPVPYEGALMLPVMKMIEQNYEVPVCVINNAIGATQIESHLIGTVDPNPFYFQTMNTSTSAPYNPIVNESSDGVLLRRVYKAGLENNIKGFIWYQGESNAFHAGYPTGYYKGKFKDLYDAFAANIPSMSSSSSPNSSFKTYFVQIHSVSDPTYQYYSASIPCANLLSEDMRTISSPNLSYANITVISANGARFPNCDGVHFNDAGYVDLATRIYRAMKMGNYGATYNVANLAPNIVSAQKQALTNTVFLTFNQPLSTTLSDKVSGSYDGILNGIYLSNGANKIAGTGAISGSIFSFNVSTTVGLSTIGYLGNIPATYSTSTTSGCSTTPSGSLGWWAPVHLRNSNDIAALSFHNIPVAIYEGARVTATTNTDNSQKNELLVFPNPTDGLLNIQSREPVNLIKIIDVQGQEMFVQIINGQTELEIDLGFLTPGIYTVMIRTGLKTIYKKISIY